MSTFWKTFYFKDIYNLAPEYSISIGTEYKMIRGNLFLTYNLKQYHDDIYDGVTINNLDLAYVFNFPNLSIDFQIDGGGLKDYEQQNTNAN